MRGLDIIAQNTIKTTVPKGKILQRTGDKSVKAFFVNKGLLRSYTIDENGKEHIFMFAPEDWLITDVELLSNHSEAMLYIDALEESEIEIIDARIFDNIDKLSTEILCDQIAKVKFAGKKGWKKEPPTTFYPISNPLAL